MAPPLTTIRGGPWKGVFNTTDPFDDTPDMLVDATNGYIPDPQGGSAFYERPAWLGPTSVPGQRPGQEVFGFVGTDGTPYNFIFENGKVFRFLTDLTTPPTDVTPSNVAIHNGVDGSSNPIGQRFIFCNQLNNSLIVSDGINKPWVGTNLSSTPITATAIEWNSPAVVLSRGSTDTKVANAALTYNYYQNHVNTVASLAANAVGTTIAAGTIPLNKWGVYRVVVDNTGTPQVSAGAANFTTGYNTEELAIAAVPAPDTTGYVHFNLGYFTVQTKTGTTFIGGTDALFGGTSGNVANATNYYAGEGTPWAAFGNVEVYGGDVACILSFLGTTPGRTTIGWSEPNQPTVGFQQTNYDNAWTLTQTGSTPLFALKATNVALFYAREGAWGKLLGQPSVNFKNDASHDAVSYNIGTTSPKSVQLFGNYLYFLDAVGRHYRMSLGGVPEPLWLQLRAPYDDATASGNTGSANLTYYAWSVIEPNLNLWITACWPLAATSPYSPTTFQVFDAITGRYVGVWTCATDRYLDVAGQAFDASGVATVVALGLAPANGPFGAVPGQIWTLCKVSDNKWTDNQTGAYATYTPNVVSLQTQRFGYSANKSTTVQEVRALAGLDVPCTATALTTNGLVNLGSTSPVGTVLLSRGSTDTRVASTAISYVLRNTAYSKAAVAAGTALPAGTILTNTWGIYRVTVNSAGTITMTGGAQNTTGGYTTEDAAILGIPQVPVTDWNMGYLTVLTKVGSAFIAGTDALAGGVSGNVASQTNYYAGQTSADGIFRFVWSPEIIKGRGTQVIVGPDSSTNQWMCFGVEVDVATADAQQDER